MPSIVEVLIHHRRTVRQLLAHQWGSLQFLEKVLHPRSTTHLSMTPLPEVALGPSALPPIADQEVLVEKPSFPASTKQLHADTVAIL